MVLFALGIIKAKVPMTEEAFHEGTLKENSRVFHFIYEDIHTLC